MSFDIGNFWKEGNSEGDFKTRFNPFANSSNAEILKVDECGGCDIVLNVILKVVADDLILDFGLPTVNYTDVHFKISITDGKGNFVTDVDEIPVDVSALDKNASWKIVLELWRGDVNPAIDCKCSKQYIFDFYPNGGEQEFNETLSGAFILASLDKDGQYSNELNLGNIDGASATKFFFYIKNTGGAAATVTGLSADGDLSNVEIFLPQIGIETLYVGDTLYLSAIITTTVAGVYTGKIYVTLSSGQTYEIEVTGTVLP